MTSSRSARPIRAPRPRRHPLAALALLAVVAAACGVASALPGAAPAAAALPAPDSARLIADLFRLAHDSMGGRAAMTPENAKARRWLAGEFRRIGLAPAGATFEHPFVRAPRRGSADSLRGANVLGLLRGRVHPERVLVVSAHYDHVGTRNGQVYNGADDNASGTAAVLAMAEWFTAHPPAHTILFALWDAEEVGLQGARAFVAAPPVPLASIAANVNLDMVARGDKALKTKDIDVATITVDPEEIKERRIEITPDEDDREDSFEAQLGLSDDPPPRREPAPEPIEAAEVTETKAPAGDAE